jgi:four helix bundle protein
MYGLRSQIRRAATSIPTNITEGAAREGDKQFARFLNIAFASANEAAYLLTLSYELGFIANKEFLILNDMINEIIKMLRSLIHRLKP